MELQLDHYQKFDFIFDMYNEGRIDFDDAVKRYIRSLAGFAIESSHLDTDDNMWPFQ